MNPPFTFKGWEEIHFFARFTQVSPPTPLFDGINLLFGRSAPAGRKKYVEAGRELSAQDIDDDWCDLLHRHDIPLVGTPHYVSEKIEMHQQRFGCEHMAL